MRVVNDKLPIVIALRVDVDFEVGLRIGVPKIMNLLKKNSYDATFFINMGMDSFGKNTTRIRSSSYIKRIKNMNPIDILLKFGFIYVIKNILGIRKSVPRNNVNILNTVVAQEFELCLHGYDHFWWAENVFNSPDTKLIEDYKLGLNEFKKLLSMEPSSTGSPNWRTTHNFLDFLDNSNYHYLSETRGTNPCFVLKPDGVQIYKKIQIPITLPCLHEISDYLNTSNESKIINEFLSHLTSGLNVWCVHDYYEGVLRSSLFEKILIEIKRRDIPIIAMRDAFEQINVNSLQKARLIQKSLPGGRGKISWLEL
jgi:undecaprenyl phosphate-alpha-L-ara4FN deformylase